MVSHGDEAVEDAARSHAFGSLGSIIFGLALTWSVHLALFPLNDNSFFTHLATGRLILEDGSVPTTDPYTFTAAGEPWTVQSWLASVAYATAEQIGGATGIRLLVAGVYVVAAALLWRLTRPATSIVPRLLLAVSAFFVASGVWTERPYMVGFIGLALVWLALEGQFNPWILIPFCWLWVNTHGSFPFAIVLCGAVLLGSWLEQRQRATRIDLVTERRATVAVLLGCLAGAASPLGVRALTFPVQSITRSESFSTIVEWQSPDFVSGPDRVFLVLALATIASLAGSGRWRHAVPVAVFLGAALLARRNIVMALPVLTTVLAHALPDLGTLRSGTRPRFGGAAAVLTFALAPLALLSGLDRPAVGLGGYPTAALSYLELSDTDGSIVTQDFVGNLLEVLDGPTGDVFVDDRVDVQPRSVREAYEILNAGRPGWAEVLDRWNAHTVIWERSDPLATALMADPGWRIDFTDLDHLIARRR